jgi:hypothetical protein
MELRDSSFHDLLLNIHDVIHTLLDKDAAYAARSIECLDLLLLVHLSSPEISTLDNRKTGDVHIMPE